jgi:hypothetical protein
MKQILIFLSISIYLTSCQTKGATSETGINKSPMNYVVLLDLSDRLISNPIQTDIDTSAIRAVFEKFEIAVKRNLVVKSKEKFSVRVIPQQGSSLPINDFENNLSIDLGNYTAAEKLKKLNEFLANLGPTLKMLYQQAFLGNKPGNYFGVDIWQYFNEQINTDINDGYDNHIVVLTDGYFDFEDEKRGMSSSNQSTVTKNLMTKLTDLNWKETAETNQIGILPVKLKPNVKFVVAGIQAKTDGILESTKLSYLWKKWLIQSGAQNVCGPIINTSSGKIKSLIKENL